MVVAIERRHEIARAPLRIAEREQARECNHCGALDFCASCDGDCYVCGREIVQLEVVRNGPTPFTSTLRVLRYRGDSPAMRDTTMTVRTIQITPSRTRLLFTPQAQAQSARSLVQQGNQAYESKNYQEALDAYEKAAEIEPDSPRIWFNKGDALYQQGEFEKALDAYEQA
ncbi:MAG: tetratricopeptide repeat protein, partial [Chloroflexi bacterium]|nr:tetratricopeptide repeat protein [Chloroflexota bacterium]